MPNAEKFCFNFHYWNLWVTTISTNDVWIWGGFINNDNIISEVEWLSNFEMRDLWAFPSFVKVVWALLVHCSGEGEVENWEQRAEEWISQEGMLWAWQTSLALSGFKVHNLGEMYEHRNGSFWQFNPCLPPLQLPPPPPPPLELRESRINIALSLKIQQMQGCKTLYLTLIKFYQCDIQISAKRRGCLPSYSQAEPGRELTQPRMHL